MNAMTCREFALGFSEPAMAPARDRMARFGMGRCGSGCRDVGFGHMDVFEPFESPAITGAEKRCLFPIETARRRAGTCFIATRRDCPRNQHRAFDRRYWRDIRNV